VKTPIDAPKIWIWWEFDPLNGKQYIRNIKGTSLCEFAWFEPSSIKVCHRSHL